VSPFPRDHARLAAAIVAAYQVLEELDLGIPASGKNPSRPNGEWNPTVRKDLERRLTAAKVDLGDLALWQRRGTPRRVEKRRPTKPVKRAEWAGHRIRDEEVEVVDAIADLSWLRSHASSHGLSRAVSLTGYEVANAQYIARRVLLSRIGMWRAAPALREVDGAFVEEGFTDE
jgi:hypothetical protein